MSAMEFSLIIEDKFDADELQLLQHI